MKWYALLKSKAGKIEMTIPKALVTSAVIGIGATTLLHNVSEVNNNRRLAVRSLTSISNPATYDGMQGDPLSGFTSIQVKDGLNQIATREEREKMDDGSAGNFGIDSVEGLQGRMSGINIGAAAETGETEGLGMGANRAAFLGGEGETVTVGGYEVAPVRAERSQGAPAEGAAGKTGNAGGETPRLANASMAHANGNAFSAAAGAITGGNAGGAGSSASVPSPAYQFSGAMPDGSSAVSSLAGNTSSRSSQFIAGGKNGRVGRGSRGDGKGDIKDIAKRSADAAGNANRSTNEGGRAFLAAATNSAGMEIDGVETETTGSADMTTPTDRALKKLNAKTNKMQSNAERQSKARKKLLNLLLAVIASTFAILPMMSWFLRSADLAWWNWAAAAALGAILGFMAYRLIDMADAYGKEYNATVFPMVCHILAGGVFAGIAFTLITRGKVWKWMTKAFNGILKSVWSFIGVPTATSLVTNDVINSDK